ncbi:DNA cytosine methyltransferase [Polynucleobacter sp. AP-RePozz3-80-G7]|uniref:DNA cytosine methyltransferase n=1 Tax=Polynucleobacter sp. AP-RePozz3-80-G7 TaxID=2689105 RepID=UPI00351D8BB5
MNSPFLLERGGGILASHILGFRTVCAVEWEPYPASVLCARQNEGFFPPFPIWDDVQTFDGKPWRGIVDVISGGFPCQDISAAGNGAGITGNRSSMWKHMARIIGEVRPQYVFVENSPMLTSRGLGVVLGDLASMGFDAEWGVLSAADVGANHLRERIWILAHSNGKRRERLDAIQIDGCSRSLDGQSDASNAKESTEMASVSNVAYSSLSGLSPCNQQTSRPRKQLLEKQSWGSGYEYGDRKYWKAEPNVGRVAHGMADRVDRLKAIGNGQVPLCAATAFKLLMERLSK